MVLRRGRLAARGRHRPLRGGGALARWCALGNVARRAVGCIPECYCYRVDHVVTVKPCVEDSVLRIEPLPGIPIREEVPRVRHVCYRGARSAAVAPQGGDVEGHPPA